MTTNVRRIPVPYKYFGFISTINLFPDALFTINLDGIITSWNKSAEKLYGYKIKEVVGNNVKIIVPADRSYEVEAILKRIVKGEEISDYKTIRKRKDGTLINVSIDMTSIRTLNNRIIGVSSVTRDITEQTNEKDEFQTAMLNVLQDLSDEKKELEEALAKLGTLDKMRDTILNTGHELKSPLGPIKLQSQMLLSGTLGKVNPKQKYSLQMILTNVDRLARVTGNLTDVTRLESGTILLDYGEVQLTKLIREAEEQLRAKVEEAKINLIIKPATLPIISADNQKIYEVIVNLLENAIKFTPAKGKIVVAAKKVKNEVMVQVTDTGIGMSRETLNKLFTRFYQADSDIRRRFGGTGLGLSICKGIIEAHHGKIWAESKGMGEGSTFSFMLPITKA